VSPFPIFLSPAGAAAQRTRKNDAMLRRFRPDLLFGLSGFALGAAALLLTHGADANPPHPVAHTDLLTQAAVSATPRSPHERAS